MEKEHLKHDEIMLLFILKGLPVSVVNIDACTKKIQAAMVTEVGCFVGIHLG